MCWHPKKPRTIAEIKNLGEDIGPILEWLVAQELYRKSCISNDKSLEDNLLFWQSKTHEIDFVLPANNSYIEVKSGKSSPIEFLWFLKTFEKDKLTVINKNAFEAEKIVGITMEEFLLMD